MDNKKILPVLLLLAVGGCGSSYVKIRDHRTIVATTNVNSLDPSRFEKAIFDGSIATKWSISKINDYKYKADLIHPKIVLTLFVTLDRDGYVISYCRSVNMKAKNGEIHSRYNRLVHSLDVAIRSKL